MKEVKIKDICEKGSSNLKQKDVENKNGSYPVFGASGLIGHLDTYHQENSYIAIVKDGSGIGRVTFMPPQSSVIGTMQYILPKTDYDIKYIGYCLQSLDLSKYKQGAAIPHIYFRDYGERLVKVVDSLSEQKEIVEYLDSSFAKIDKLKENAAKNLDEAKALFQSALKDALEPKKGWEEKTLKEIGITQTGTTPSKSDSANYGNYMEFIRPSEIDFNGMGGINYNCELKLSEQGASNGRVFEEKSILMVCIGATIGKVGFSNKKISCNQQINVLTPSSEYDYKFVYYSMKSPRFQKMVIKEGTSSQATLPIINKGKWEKLTVQVPSLQEQQSIVFLLDSLSEKLNTLQQNYSRICDECDALKQAILRQVFE